MDQLPRLGKRELICLLLFTCNYMVSVWRGFLFLWVLGMALTKMKRLLQGCSSVAATMQQSNMYATTGGDKVAN